MRPGTGFADSAGSARCRHIDGRGLFSFCAMRRLGSPAAPKRAGRIGDSPHQPNRPCGRHCRGVKARLCRGDGFKQSRPPPTLMGSAGGAWHAACSPAAGKVTRSGVAVLPKPLPAAQPRGYRGGGRCAQVTACSWKVAGNARRPVHWRNAARSWVYKGRSARWACESAPTPAPRRHAPTAPRSRAKRWRAKSSMAMEVALFLVIAHI